MNFTDSPLVSVIILNWNKASETLACLESVTKLEYPNCSIVVVDNGSTDNSVAQIASQFPEIELLETNINLGYAEGNNVGIRHALQKDAKYLFVLNNDVRVAPDTLNQLVSVAEQFPKVTLLGPKVYHLDSSNQIQSAGGKLDYLWRSKQRGLDNIDYGQFDVIEDVDYVIGAAVLVRANHLKKVGLLDSDFFLYREDIDWCLRVRRAGYRVLYVPGAKIWHRSHHVRERELPRVTYYMARNSLMLLRKHQVGGLRFTILMLRHLLTVISWTIRPKWRHKRQERDALLKGVLDFLHGRVGQGYG